MTINSDESIGAQVSKPQYEKILNYIKIGREEGAEVLVGGEPQKLEGELANGYYIQPTILKGHNKMRVFQEEIFGPVVCRSSIAPYLAYTQWANRNTYASLTGNILA